MTANTSGERRGYLLGHRDEELARLEAQAAQLAAPTRTILTWAGIRPGMRVLDLGTGLGDVAFLAAELVGPQGSVLGVDASDTALERARERAEAAGVRNVRFVPGNLNGGWPGPDEVDGGFDAVVGRLVLLFVDDPVAVLTRLAGLVRPDGLVVAMEYDMPALRSIPRVPMLDRARGWILDVFHRSGHDPTLGSRLVTVLTEAGLVDSTGVGLQLHLAPTSPAGPGMVSGVVRSLLPAIEAVGVATAAEVDSPNLDARLSQELLDNNAVFAGPMLVGAWARIRSS